MNTTIVPIFICVVLPIAIVLIISLRKAHSDNKRAEIIVKAIEANKDVDTDKLIESLKAPRHTPLEVLNARLQRGMMYSLIGLGLIIIGTVAALGMSLDGDPVTVPCVFGTISLAIGLSYLITYFVTRRQVQPSNND